MKLLQANTKHVLKTAICMQNANILRSLNRMSIICLDSYITTGSRITRCITTAVNI